MALNIKNEETHRMATELARLRNVTITQAVSDAISRDLDRESRRANKHRLAKELLAIAENCAAHIKGPVRSDDHAEMLYDDMGLPREDSP